LNSLFLRRNLALTLCVTRAQAASSAKREYGEMFFGIGAKFEAGDKLAIATTGLGTNWVKVKVPVGDYSASTILAVAEGMRVKDVGTFGSTPFTGDWSIIAITAVAAPILGTKGIAAKLFFHLDNQPIDIDYELDVQAGQKHRYALIPPEGALDSTVNMSSGTASDPDRLKSNAQARMVAEMQMVVSRGATSPTAGLNDTLNRPVYSFLKNIERNDPTKRKPTLELIVREAVSRCPLFQASGPGLSVNSIMSSIASVLRSFGAHDVAVFQG
jgi:hypothetical protein